MKIVIQVLAILNYAFLLSACLSTKTLNSILKEQNKIDEPLSSFELDPAFPIPIQITIANDLKDQTKSKAVSALVVPFIFINDFQVNHRIFLGKSSLTLNLEEDFGMKLNEAILSSDFPWSEIPNKEFILS